MADILKITFEISGEKITLETDADSLDSSFRRVKSMAKAILEEGGSASESASKGRRGRKPGPKAKKQDSTQEKKPAKRGPKPGRKAKANAARPGRPAKASAAGGKKRGRKPGSTAAKAAGKAKVGRRGRPSKAATENANQNGNNEQSA